MSYKFLLLFILVPMSVHAACPDGFTAYLGPESNRYRNANGDCVELCGAGITSLNTSNGYRFDLFATRNTTPAINVKHGDTVCYIDLISGQSDGTLNVNFYYCVLYQCLYTRYVRTVPRHIWGRRQIWFAIPTGTVLSCAAVA
ncbi:MAG: hypothetical protein IKJ62_01895 [Alphaproteobacteria bacterium]|nr:hypothetical protein [Alphaproteobacteria bacterium]